MKKIHKKWNTLELLPKGLKEVRKLLETGTGNHTVEAGYIKDIDFLKQSKPFIEQKEVIEA